MEQLFTVFDEMLWDKSHYEYVGIKEPRQKEYLHGRVT